MLFCSWGVVFLVLVAFEFILSYFLVQKDLFLLLFGLVEVRAVRGGQKPHGMINKCERGHQSLGIQTPPEVL